MGARSGSVARTGNGKAIGSAASRLRPSSSKRSRPRSVTSMRSVLAVDEQVRGDPGDARPPHHPVAAGRRDGDSRDGDAVGVEAGPRIGR